MDQARKRICELEDSEFYIIWSEQRKKSEESLHDLWDTIRRTICELLEFQKENITSSGQKVT